MTVLISSIFLLLQLYTYLSRYQPLNLRPNKLGTLLRGLWSLQFLLEMNHIPLVLQTQEMPLHCLTFYFTCCRFSSIPCHKHFLLLSQMKALKTRLWYLHAALYLPLLGTSHVLGIITLIISLHRANQILVCQILQSYLQTLPECEKHSSERLNRNGNCFNLTKELTEFPRTLTAYTHINQN